MKKTGVTVVAFKDEDAPNGQRPPMDFVQEHFNNTLVPAPEAEERPNAKTDISMSELEEAMQALSTGKASSFDQLSDRVLKAALKDSEVLRLKVLKAFNQWLNGEERMPVYLMKARTVLLSKEEGNQFPSFGKCRVLAILPILTKLFELTILKKLRKEIEEKAPINEKQRGFMPGCSTIQNVDDVFSMMEAARAQMKEQIARKVKLANRPKRFLLFTDMSVAFDTIQRHTLFAQMRSKGIDGNLVETIREMLDMAVMSDGNQDAKTSIGSMQGSTLSPMLFAFYINDMLGEL